MSRLGVPKTQAKRLQMARPAVEAVQMGDLVSLVADLRDIREHPGLHHWAGRTIGIVIRRVMASFSRVWYGSEQKTRWYVDLDGLRDAMLFLDTGEVDEAVAECLRSRITQIVRICKKEIRREQEGFEGMLPGCGCAECDTELCDATRGCCTCVKGPECTGGLPGDDCLPGG